MTDFARMIPLAILLAAGCATSRPVQKVDEAEVQRLTATGYASREHGGFSQTEQTWDSSSGAVDLALRLPSGSSPVPWVIYLPGIGESSVAARSWTDEWARSGYAVLSVQPLEADVQAWSSPAAHNGDFNALGRERYSATVMSNRLQVLREVMAEVVHRHDAGDPAMSRLDLSRAALAGFDLGAHTAMVTGGEQLPGLASAKPMPIPLAAVIALSPYSGLPAHAAGSDAPQGANRSPSYAAMTLPVLSITSDDDQDPLGLVKSPTWRRAPFDALPAGGKYLVMLSQITHATLSGPPIDQLVTSNCDSGDDDSTRRNRAQSSGSRRQNGAAAFSVRPQVLCGVSISPTSQALGIAVAQSVSVAFLDTYLRRDARAEAWLRRDAANWMSGLGRIEEK